MNLVLWVFFFCEECELFELVIKLCFKRLYKQNYICDDVVLKVMRGWFIIYVVDCLIKYLFDYQIVFYVKFKEEELVEIVKGCGISVVSGR